MNLKTADASYLPIMRNFDCSETDEELATFHFNSKQRKRIRKRSAEINEFLIKNSIKDKKDGMNVTHLLLNDDSSDIIGFVTLCNDSIYLTNEEKERNNVRYSTVPAIKYVEPDHPVSMRITLDKLIENILPITAEITDELHNAD